MEYGAARLDVSLHTRCAFWKKDHLAQLNSEVCEYLIMMVACLTGFRTNEVILPNRQRTNLNTIEILRLGSQRILPAVGRLKAVRNLISS